MSRVFVFGNPHLACDNFALSVAEKLCEDGQIQVIKCRSPDDLLSADKSENLVLLDVAKGLQEPAIIDENRLKAKNMMSLHDFDVGYFITLMRKLGDKRRIRIIGVPETGDETAVAHEVKKWI